MDKMSLGDLSHVQFILLIRRNEHITFGVQKIACNCVFSKLKNRASNLKLLVTQQYTNSLLFYYILILKLLNLF